MKLYIVYYVYDFGRDGDSLSVFGIFDNRADAENYTKKDPYTNYSIEEIEVNKPFCLSSSGLDL